MLLLTDVLNVYWCLCMALMFIEAHWCSWSMLMFTDVLDLPITLILICVPHWRGCSSMDWLHVDAHWCPVCRLMLLCPGCMLMLTDVLDVCWCSLMTWMFINVQIVCWWSPMSLMYNDSNLDLCLDLCGCCGSVFVGIIYKYSWFLFNFETIFFQTRPCSIASVVSFR